MTFSQVSGRQTSRHHNFSMTRFQEILWPRIFAEGTAIIVSILLAFWIQAWREGLQGQGDERIFLQSLLDDLNHKKEWLRNKKRHSEAIFESATQHLSLSFPKSRSQLLMTGHNFSRPYLMSLFGLTMSRVQSHKKTLVVSSETTQRVMTDSLFTILKSSSLNLPNVEKADPLNFLH